jgi:hypothetical protein
MGAGQWMARFQFHNERRRRLISELLSRPCIQLHKGFSKSTTMLRNPGRLSIETGSELMASGLLRGAGDLSVARNCDAP